MSQYIVSMIWSSYNYTDFQVGPVTQGQPYMMKMSLKSPALSGPPSKPLLSDTWDCVMP